MKTIEFDIVMDHHPETIEENLANPEFLDYLTENHPAIEKIRVLEVKEVNAHQKIYKMKYITVTPMPKALKKIMQSKSDEMTSGMTMVIEVNKESFSSRSEVFLEMMTDNVKSTSLASYSQKGDKWIVHIEISVSVKVFGLGGTIEKHYAELSKELTEKQFALINKFLNRNR